MKKISAIAWKDFRLRFTNPSEFLFFLILPPNSQPAIPAMEGITASRSRWWMKMAGLYQIS